MTSVTDGTVVRFILTANSRDEALATVRQEDAEGVYARLEVVGEDDFKELAPASTAPTPDQPVGAESLQKEDGVGPTSS